MAFRLRSLASLGLRGLRSSSLGAQTRPSMRFFGKSAHDAHHNEHSHKESHSENHEEAKWYSKYIPKITLEQEAQFWATLTFSWVLYRFYNDVLAGGHHHADSGMTPDQEFAYMEKCLHYPQRGYLQQYVDRNSTK
eukprot:TRINITY_DN1403_c0_g1_i1.p1 TRINITY_DN1403_c0_g1~~TRINITY_DN1403_c0_g1_i1.p1  ORF type:complete len:160 (-),score=46.01 TRINITY_DN1403_c0_g1_i1:195-602(-)